MNTRHLPIYLSTFGTDCRPRRDEATALTQFSMQKLASHLKAFKLRAMHLRREPPDTERAGGWDGGGRAPPAPWCPKLASAVCARSRANTIFVLSQVLALRSRSAAAGCLSDGVFFRVVTTGQQYFARNSTRSRVRHHRRDFEMRCSSLDTSRRVVGCSIQRRRARLTYDRYLVPLRAM